MLERLGEIDRYIEPFAGSMAVLLHRRDPFLREIVCDTSGLLCNFWRAVRADPEQTAHWAEYPTIHQDLTARHKWLLDWSAENAQRLCDDPEFHDAKAAGWWCWGISNWIGGGFCEGEGRPWEIRPPDKRPHVKDPHGGGQGVQVQRISEQRPHVDPRSGGQGVQVQRSDTRPHVGAKRTGAQGVQVQRLGIPDMPQIQRHGTPYDKRPYVRLTGGRGVQTNRKDTRPHDKRPHVRGTAQGVQVQRTNMDEFHPGMPIGGTGFIIDWFNALAHRLRRVVVFNRDWTSVISPTILGNTETERNLTGLFLDPPYLTSDRSKSLYTSDYAGTSDEAAVESYKWAVENGSDYRIAYACHEGDFPIPEGWDAETLSFSGPNLQRKLDMVMFSPACVPKGKSERRNALIDAMEGS